MTAAPESHLARPHGAAPQAALNHSSRHCITCGDDGDPMTVVAIDPVRGLAVCVAEDGRRSSVEIALVEPVAVADRLLVHAGTAIAQLPPEDARR